MKDEGVEFDLSSLLAFVRRQKTTILLATGFMVLLGLAYLMAAAPKYTATASVVLDTKRVQLAQMAQEPAVEPMTDTGLVESQVETLKSERIARVVIEKLELTQDPEFVGSGPSLIKSLQQAAASLLGHQPNEAAEQRERFIDALSTYDKMLGVRRVGVSYVVNIGFSASQPDKAALIANAIANAYIADRLDSRSEMLRHASVWLEGRIDELRQRASEAE
ncbi:MAG: Wzz/FepE/Etk N-terminal domain-containing protein, partial [Gammaproteobacteria bacterium]